MLIRNYQSLSVVCYILELRSGGLDATAANNRGNNCSITSSNLESLLTQLVSNFVFLDNGLLVISECSIYVPPEHTGGNFVFDLVDVNGISTQNGTGVLVARDPTHDGPPGTVCDDGFSHISATVICKEMGYTCAEYWGTGTPSSYLESLDIVIDNVQCLDINQPFANCSYNSDHNCGHNEDITLRCDRLCEFDFKLVDSTGALSTNNSGLLVATKLGTGKNGTVCDDNFGGEAALVICRLMGHSCAASWAKRTEWELQSSMDILLDDVTCSVGAPNSTFTESCSWKIVTNCDHNEDIHLSCGCISDKYQFYTLGSDGEKDVDGSGLLIAKEIVTGTTKGNEGTVCDDSFADAAANTICTLMGFSCSVFWESAGEAPEEPWPAVQANYSVVLDNVECREDLSGEGHCSYSIEPNCKHSEDIFLHCGSEAQCFRAAFMFYTVDRNGEKTTNGSGLLIAARSFYEAAAGTVCDDNFNSISATLICKEMGYECSVGWHAGANWEQQDSYDIALDNIMCGSTNKTFAECQYDTQHNCGHSEDIFLSCAYDCTYNFYLVDDAGAKTTTGTGLLVASRSLTHENGTVCDDSFTDTSASVICKEMGFACSVYWNSGEETEVQTSMNMSIMLDNVKCVDDALNFLNCSFSSGGHNCNHREDVHLVCSENCEKETISFSLTNGAGEDATETGTGLLLASRDIADSIQVKGTVCDDEFSLIAGNVICKSMNFDCAQSFHSGEQWEELQGGFNIVLDNVVCTDGENLTFAENCTYSVSHNCGHSEDVFLVCASGDDCSIAKATKFSLVTSTGAPSTSGSGLLIATTVQTTGTVCDDRWSDVSAAAVCSEMGYLCALSWTSSDSSWEIQNSYTIAMDNLYCESDNFTTCTFDLAHNCGHTEDVFLECSHKCLTSGAVISAQLVDNEGTLSTTGQGLLLVTSKGDDIADTVCNKGFEMVDGMAFCRTMGYSCALAVSSAEQDATAPWAIQSTYDIMMSDVECEEGAKNLTACNYNLVHDCDHINDVYLTCGGVQNIARVGVASQDSTHSDAGAWKAIDGNILGSYFTDDSTTHTALNAPTGHVWRVTWDREYTVGSIVIYNRADCCQERLIGATIHVNGQVVGTVSNAEGADMSRFEFTGLNLVTNQVEIVGGTEGAALEALSLAEVEVFLRETSSTTKCVPTFSLINENGTASTTGHGLLVAHSPGYTDSETGAGTVCDDLFSDESANVVCKTMGYQCSSSWSHGDRWSIQATLDVILDDVQCPSNTSPFTNCTYIANNHNCAHTEDVFLTCDNGLIPLGCWLDTGIAGQGAAIPSLEGGNPVSDQHWTAREDPISICKLAAESKGWTVFAVQAGGWCSSSLNAGDSYSMYGTSNDCNDNGTGGPWANSVYNITESGIEALGCYRDTASRAIPSLEHEDQHPMLDGEPYYRENPVEKCRQAAKASGFEFFAVQAGGYCMSSAEAGTMYKVNGKSDLCTGDGQGGHLANDVYQIRDNACSVVNKDYKFYFVDEKGARATNSGLLIAEGKSGPGELPGTVCDDMFNDTSATVICKEMGFTCSTGWSRKFWEVIQKQYPIVLDDVQCGADNISFSDCTFKTSSNCGHNEDIFLGCDSECLPAKYVFELVDAETGQTAAGGKGLLIAAKNGTDTRGTVCDDEFNDTAATLICQAMGYVCAKGHYLQRPSTTLQGTLDIVLDNIKCSNTTKSFDDCPYVTGHNCVHSEDVFLTCKHTLEECEAKELYTFHLVDRQLQDVTTSGSGLLMANRTEEGKTGTVCDDRFNETSAKIICNEMGFNCATAFFNAASYKGVQENETIVLDNVECGEAAQRFTDCSYQFHHDCTHNEDVFLICQQECKGKPFAFNLVDDQGHQTTAGEGLILVHTLKSIEGATSGTVCGDNFNQEAAAVICKQMGHDHATRWTTRDHKGIQMMYPAIMNNVSCANTDQAFGDCSYAFDHECTEDVYLICQTKETPVSMCPAGSHYEDDTCQPCEPNTYKALYNGDPCVRCAPGSVSAVGSSSCTVCPETSVNVGENWRCTCSDGTYFNMNNGQCETCPPNTYISDPLSSTCITCPAGSTSAQGATSCTCSPGSVWSLGTCKECGADNYSSAGGTCEKCPDVPVLEDKSGCKCESGRFWNSAENACAVCPANSVSVSGAKECTQCPQYTVISSSGTKCSFCEEGKHWVDYQCLDCPDGSVGNKIDCLKVGAADNQGDTHAVKAGAAGNAWLWPVIVAVVLAIACVVLVFWVINLRNKVRRNTVSYGTDILEEAEFMEMSYEPRITDLSSADNVQLLPADD